MDKRTVFAIVLIFAVIVGGNLLSNALWPRPEVTTVDTARVDSLASRDSLVSRDTLASPAAATVAPRQAVVPPRSTIGAATSALVPTRPETTMVASTGREIRFVTPGAAPSSITLTEYPDLKRREGSLSLAPTNGQLLRYRIVNGTDTIHFDRLAFSKTQTARGVEFVSASPAVRVTYDLDTANYITRASIALAGAAPDARVLIDLAPDLATGEADEAEDIRNLAYGFRPSAADVQSTVLTNLDSTEAVVQAGPLEWVAIRNKYFLIALLSPDSTKQFSGFVMRGGSRGLNNQPTGTATATLPLSDGVARFDMYTGPQSWKVLRAVGHDLSNVNPYGWSLVRPIVEPFATIVMRMLLGMKALVGLSYGWVLVIFGILIRLLLWPMNQTAMRTSIKMQALQPELAAVQKRHAKDPEAQRTAMMKLYADHGMSPFSPLMGCLPMLIPMPILFALYFVFQNTIEFRGVPFLWLPDISLKDPYYITPILMGASMLVLSWIGLRVGPPNPQAKIMGYMMPAMFTIMFLNFASGLNLYYAVQNLVAIPQQWLLTRERLKAAGSAPVKGPPPTKQRK